MGGTEIGFDAEVDLHGRVPNQQPPRLASCGGHHLGESEHAGVEAPRRGLTSGRHRELDVIDGEDAHAQSLLDLERQVVAWPHASQDDSLARRADRDRRVVIGTQYLASESGEVIVLRTLDAAR